MGKLILIILSLSLFLFPVSSHALSEYDGHEWSNWTTSEKTYFLIGFISGSGYVVGNSFDSWIGTEKSDKKSPMGIILNVTEREIETNKRSEFIRKHAELKDSVKYLPSKYRAMLQQKEKELKIK